MSERAQVRGAARAVLTMFAAAAAYGFAIGASNSLCYATRNLVKLPLPIVGTALLCAVLYHLLARFFAARLGFVQVQRVVMAVFRDISVLLCALTPVVAFLALTMQRPDRDSLGDYPAFQGVNVLAIATCGCLSVWRRSRELLAERVVARARRPWLIATWMLASLLVGGQIAWFVRPFFGVHPGRWSNGFCSGRAPDHNGATSIYEAVWNLVDTPERWR